MHLSYLRLRPLFAITTFLSFIIILRWKRCQVERLWRTPYRIVKSQDLIKHKAIDHQRHLEFWQALEYMLSNNGPGIPRPSQNGSAPNKYYDANDAIEPIELIEMDEDELESMKKGHDNYVRALRVHAPQLAYNPGTRGIVCTAGGAYLPLVIITLRMLRRMESILPVEVFLESAEEYESYVCETILPALNGRCIIMSEILNPVPHPVPIEHFQLKIFALLLSSFEDVLFLDADSWPIEDPTKLFNSEPFSSRGFIVWPDFWYATPSKYFYEISSLPRPKTNYRAASEAGQMLISKKTHAKTLLMAAYYNYWGPEHYYPLLAQGGPGEGDKETFIVSAEMMREPFYDVSEKTAAVGHTGDDGGIAGSAMVQFDPIEDYKLTKLGIWRKSNPSLAPSPKPCFLHVSFPKFNPGRIYDDWGLLHWDNGTLRKAWLAPEEILDMFPADLEKRYWEEARWVACNLERKLRDWYGAENVCEKAQDYYSQMFGE